MHFVSFMLKTLICDAKYLDAKHLKITKDIKVRCKISGEIAKHIEAGRSGITFCDFTIFDGIRKIWFAICKRSDMKGPRFAMGYKRSDELLFTWNIIAINDERWRNTLKKIQTVTITNANISSNSLHLCIYIDRRDKLYHGRRCFCGNLQYYISNCRKILCYKNIRNYKLTYDIEFCNYSRRDRETHD